MKKNTKKKLLSVMLIIALLAIAVVGGTLAWFTDEDEVTNTFTVGSIEIKQNEVFNEDTANLMPVVGTEPNNADDNYIQKKVTVSNTGKNPAYIQTIVAVPTILDESNVLKLWDNNHKAYGWSKLDGDNSTDNGAQAYLSGIPVDINGTEVDYNLYYYRYNTPLAPGDTTGACLEYVYINAMADMNTYGTDGNGTTGTGYFVMNGEEIEGFNAFSKLDILVLTQAVQAEGFPDAATALTQAFGTDAPNFSA